jgi:hypothetical protein
VPASAIRSGASCRQVEHSSTFSRKNDDKSRNRNPQIPSRPLRQEISFCARGFSLSIILASEIMRDFLVEGLEDHEYRYFELLSESWPNAFANDRWLEGPTKQEFFGCAIASSEEVPKMDN